MSGTCRRHPLRGKKIFEGTMKRIFQKHFVFNSDGHSWSLNPHDDPNKVQKRVIPTIRMVASWVDPENIIPTWTDRKVVDNFLIYIKHCHNDLWISKHPVCELCSDEEL